MKKNKVENINRICVTDGYVGPMHVCGMVSVYSDKKGHRCMAHGNTKCKHKKVLNNEPK